jgi:hypothetical protein
VTYDKGYLVCYNFFHTSTSAEQIALLKTDINGFKIFEKQIGEPYLYNSHNGGFCLTPDGGVVISGQIFSEDGNGDPFVLKLDACYNLQWCNIYNTPNLYDWAGGICYLPWDSSFVFTVFNHYYDLSEKRISLFKIDQQGDLVWNNLYCTNPDYYNETLVHNTVCEYDSSLILYGYVQVHDSNGSASFQPYWSKIHSDGDTFWELYSIPDSTFVTGVAEKQPLFMQSGRILCPTQSYYGQGNRLTELDFDGTYLGNQYIHQPDSVEFLEITNSENLGESSFIVSSILSITSVTTLSL